MRKVFRSIAPIRLALAAAALLFCCQSRAQIIASNLSQLQDDLINGATYVYLQSTTPLNPTGVLEIVEDVTIDATGFNVIIGGTSNQVFYVDPGVNFTLINVTMSGAFNAGPAGGAGASGVNGTGNGNGATGNPGGNGSDAFGGAVFNAGNSTFINCLFLTNTVVGGNGGSGGNGGNSGGGLGHGGNGGNGGNGGVGYGGAIYNMGTLLLSNCSVAGNITIGGTAGFGGTNGTGGTTYPGTGGSGTIGAGGGLYNAGIATIINSTFNQNFCQGGSSQTGGTSTSGPGNAGSAGANAEGGGVYNYGTNIFLNCTFFANTVTGGNGGNGGNALTNSLSKGGTGGNGGYAVGGGLYNAGIVNVTNCTFSGGVAIGGTNGVGGSGYTTGNSGSPGLPYGANIANGGVFLLKNSILDFPTNAASAYGSISDQGNNLSSDATPAFSTTNSFNSKNPQLSPSGLQANGSIEVLTIALSGNSPAINAIYDGSAPAYDERGFVRPGQIRPDIGAFEFGSFTPTYDVSGTVTIGGNPFPGVPVSVGAQATTITDSNGNFVFSLPQSNFATIHPNPGAYFNPSSTSVYVSTNNITGLLFKATNALAHLTNGTGTNTNTFVISFAGIPSNPTASPAYSYNYIIQATTNLSTNPIVWTNLATNNSGSNGIIPFSYSLSGTNLTNFQRRFFRAVP